MQPRLQLLHTWTHQLHQLAPDARITRIRTWALLSLGLLWSGRITLLAAAATIPLSARDLRLVRRFRRWLANPAVDVATLWTPVLRALLAGRRELLVVFDPSPQASHTTVLILGLVVHKRTLPIAWRAMPQHSAWPEPQIDLLRGLCQQVIAAMPADCQATLLADRGITCPAVIDLCQELGWHSVLRLPATKRQRPRYQHDDETSGYLWDLVPKRGGHWFGTVTTFQSVDWRTLELTIVWPSAYDHPWLLLSDRPAGRARQREYRRRIQCEATYEDSKSRGWQLEASQVRTRDRLERLLLAFALTLWWAHGLGRCVVRSGQRRRFDRPDRRDRSLVRLGLRYLQELLKHEQIPPLPFRYLHDHLRYRWLT